MFAMVTGIFTAAVMTIGAVLTAAVAAAAGFLAARRAAYIVLQSGFKLPAWVEAACASLTDCSYEVNYCISNLEPLSYVVAICAAVLAPWMGLFWFCAAFVTTAVLSATNALLNRYYPNIPAHVKSTIFELVARACVVATEQATNEVVGSDHWHRNDKRRRKSLYLAR